MYLSQSPIECTCNNYQIILQNFLVYSETMVLKVYIPLVANVPSEQM